MRKIKILAILFILAFCGCERITTDYSVCTIIGIDKSGSFIIGGDMESKKKQIGSLIYRIINKKAEIQVSDSNLFKFRKTFSNIKSDKFEQIYVNIISFRGISGVDSFQMANGTPLDICKEDKRFSSAETIYRTIFPENEKPAKFTDFIQFFQESLNNIKNIEDPKIRIHFILVTDGLPDINSDSTLIPSQLTTQEIKDKFSDKYITELSKIFTTSTKISFIGCDTNTAAFWSYVIQEINKKKEANRNIVIEFIGTSKLEAVYDSEITKLANPFRW